MATTEDGRRMGGRRTLRRAGTPDSSHALLARALTVALTALPVAMALGAAAASAAGWSETELACRRGFHLICHQRPDRSFALWGAPLAVCARCFGAWSGFFVGALAAAFVPWLERFGSNPKRSVLLGLLIPAVLHPLLGKVGLTPDTPLLRAATAFTAAVACGVVLLAAVVDLFERRAESQTGVPFTGAPHAEA